jgi:hypothetical protein
MQFALSIRGARRPRRIRGACVMAYKEVALKNWQMKFLLILSSSCSIESKTLISD